jgi:putative ABC transport system permease protein
MGSITLGVAALVAINSFRGDVITAVNAESRNLLGAALEVHSNRALPEPVQDLLDSVAATGTPISYVTTFPSMALAPKSDLTRLVQVKALTGGFPYYGTVETEPTDVWSEFQDARRAIVDRAVVIQLDVTVGDTLLIGESQFEIAGVITASAGEISFRSAIGPRVFIPATYLQETRLLRFGSIARYQAYLKIEDNPTLQNFLNRYNQFFRDNGVGYDTVAEQVEDMTRMLGNMTRFLGLVGLTALLLGGVGVASAVHVFIKEKLETVAVLRCLGATQATVFTAYLVQAAALGLAGAAAGVVVGLLVQKTLPSVLGDFLPIDVTISVNWIVVVAGLLIGIWVACVFALLPLLGIRDITPLRALRREFEQIAAKRNLWRWLVSGALGASVIALSVSQAPMFGMGFYFAGAIAVTALLLWLTALLLIRSTRRYFPKRARYVVRQGVANLFRPHNQTVAVTIALGFGVFLVATIYIVQRNLIDRLTMEAGPNRPNFVAFDIQTDQRDGITELFETYDAPLLQLTPIVPARISHLNERTVAELLADTVGPRMPRWALRRDYRHTYRDTLVTSEELVAGAWWDEGNPRGDGLPRISIEQDIARDLHVGIGDRITWDVQGVSIETQIASIRTVNWARFETNFFVVFEPGVLENAPQMLVSLARVDDPTTRAEVQRDLVRSFPNVSAIDLALVQEALDSVVSKVALAIRFMALFSIASGIIVLVGAIATSRYQRMRESVLLKTLGANSKQIRHILLTEYAALGTLSGLTGILLAGVAGWALVTFMFELSFRVPAPPLIALWLGVVVLTVVIGLVNSREVVRKPPLAVIREMAE